METRTGAEHLTEKLGLRQMVAAQMVERQLLSPKGIALMSKTPRLAQHPLLGLTRTRSLRKAPAASGVQTSPQASTGSPKASTNRPSPPTFAFGHPGPILPAPFNPVHREPRLLPAALRPAF